MEEGPNTRDIIRERMNWLAALARSGKPTNEVMFEDVDGEILESGAATLDAKVYIKRRGLGQPVQTLCVSQ